MIEINTNKYTRFVKVNIDGKEWTMTPPGAGDELALSQAQRRMNLLDKKMSDGTAVEEDYDLYDQLELKAMSVFKNMFKDGSDDNHEANEWINNTPLAQIQLATEEIQSQVKKQQEENGKTAAKPAQD